MQISFYSGFSKRVNSTKRPGTATVTLTGTLKEECSIENPVILLENLSPNTLPGYVYAYIPAFSRYYFVAGWTYNPPYWECSLNEDYLASWKTNIGNTSAYIDRCASEYDGNIIDTRYITTLDIVNNSIPMNNSFYEYSITSGCFILGIIDSNNQTDSQMGGAVTYYVLTPAQCRSLMHYLLDDDFLSQNGFPSVQTLTQDISQEMAKAFVRPIDYIVSCTWYPLPVSAFTNASDIQISVGYWLINTSIATGKLLQSAVSILTTYGTLTNHPQAATRGDYLNFSPYTRVSIEVPPFGNIPLDLSYRTRGNIVYCLIYLDPITGVAVLHVHMLSELPSNSVNVRGEPIVYETSAQFGVPVQLAQVTPDYIGAVSEAAQAVASVDFLGGSIGLMMGGPAGAIKGAINSEVISHAANAVTSLAPQVRGCGVNGSRLLTKIKPVISVQYMPLCDEDNAEMGKPLRKIRTINTLSGYIKCFEVTVDYPCLDSEKKTIYDYLMSGFFYE